MHWKDFRDPSGAPTDGILSKAVVRYTHPRYPLRGLPVHRTRADERQFIYSPRRRVGA
jgi:hypothetical protein